MSKGRCVISEDGDELEKVGFKLRNFTRSQRYHSLTAGLPRREDLDRLARRGVTVTQATNAVQQKASRRCRGIGLITQASLLGVCPQIGSDIF